jgi:hypothetical protein
MFYQTHLKEEILEFNLQLKVKNEKLLNKNNWNGKQKVKFIYKGLNC